MVRKHMPKRPKKSIRRTISKMQKGPRRTGAPPVKQPKIEHYEWIGWTKKGVKKARKKYEGILVEKAVSMRHIAHLIEPQKPFGKEISDKERIAQKHGVLSTAVIGYEYYPNQRLLILKWWKNWKKKIAGSEYAYFDVPRSIFDGLLQASSKGRYIYYNIRTSFRYKRLN